MFNVRVGDAAAEPAGTWHRQGQRRIGDDAVGANVEVRGAPALVVESSTSYESAYPRLPS